MGTCYTLAGLKMLELSFKLSVITTSAIEFKQILAKTLTVVYSTAEWVSNKCTCFKKALPNTTLNSSQFWVFLH